MRLQQLYYASSRKYTELLIATLAALVALTMFAAFLDTTVLAKTVAAPKLAAAPINAKTIDGSAIKALTAVSAASFRSNEISPEGVVAAFGNGLATSSQVAESWPLPQSLAGTKVQLRDALGREQFTQLFFVAPGQVNFLVPIDVAYGEANITITSGDGSISQGLLRIVEVAPGLFTMNANGTGVAAANVLRLRGVTRYYEILCRYDLDVSQWITLPIDFGPSADRLFLVAYGTGIRRRASLNDVQVTIGGEPAAVVYAGPQGGMLGIDQVNAEIPRVLAGRGEVDVVLTINGKESNTARISLN